MARRTRAVIQQCLAVSLCCWACGNAQDTTTVPPAAEPAVVQSNPQVDEETGRGTAETTQRRWSAPTRGRRGGGPGTMRSGQFRPRDDMAPAQNTESLPIKNGIVLNNGVYIAPPYVVSLKDDKLLINGTRARLSPGEYDTEGGDDGDGAPPGGGRFSGRQGFGGRRRVGSQGFESLEAHLRLWGVAILRDRRQTILLGTRTGHSVVEALQVDAAVADKVDRLMELAPYVMSSPEWSALVEAYEPHPAIDDRLKAMAKASPSGLNGSSERAIHGLNLAGMVLAVASLGTLLMYRPSAANGWSGFDASSAATHLVLRCVGLLIILNIFDLAATLLCGSTGHFAELNPLARSVLHSPYAAIAFKCSLVAAGCTTLVLLRKRRIVQQASWWLCVAYTVLILRWAAFQSLLLA